MCDANFRFEGEDQQSQSLIVEIAPRSRPSGKNQSSVIARSEVALLETTVATIAAAIVDCWTVAGIEQTRRCTMLGAPEQQSRCYHDGPVRRID
jgi:hypothetical protein